MIKSSTLNKFESSIEFDQIWERRVKPLNASGDYVVWHYFKNDVEVAYWIWCSETGFVFESPRTWSKIHRMKLHRVQSTASPK